ncbi:MAG: 3-dehydroquinate synthase family protein [Bacteroidia bacterium]
MPLFTLGGEEALKSLPKARWVWKKFWQYGVDRGQQVLLIGGGSLLDLGGFCAAVWKRGVPYISLPTTLIAQIDAAYGGKTGLNFRGGKNLIGVYAPAAEVWVWPGFLQTLPLRDLRAGWAEAVKHALLDGEELWRAVRAVSFRKPPDLALLERLIRVKLHWVEKDPYELEGARFALNLGHTAGHLIESLAQKVGEPLRHGEAVAIGLIQELSLSCQRGLLPESLLAEVWAKFREEELLRPMPPFTRRLWEALLRQDKKIRAGRLYLPLLVAPGRVQIEAVEPEALYRVMRAYAQAAT